MRIHLPIGPKRGPENSVVEVAVSEIRGPFVYVDLTKVPGIEKEYQDFVRQGSPVLVILPSYESGAESARQHYLIGPLDPPLADAIPSWFRVRFPGFSEAWISGEVGPKRDVNRFRRFDEALRNLTEQEVHDAHALLSRVPAAFRTILPTDPRAPLKEDARYGDVTVGFAVPSVLENALFDDAAEIVLHFDKKNRPDLNTVVVWMKEDQTLVPQAEIYVPTPGVDSDPLSPFGPRAPVDIELGSLDTKAWSPLAAATMATLFAMTWDALDVVLDEVATARASEEGKVRIWVRTLRDTSLESKPLPVVLGATIEAFSNLDPRVDPRVYEALAAELFDASALATPSATQVIRRRQPWPWVYAFRSEIEGYVALRATGIIEYVWQRLARMRATKKKTEEQRLARIAAQQAARVKTQEQAKEKIVRQQSKRKAAEQQAKRQRFSVSSYGGADYVVSFDPDRDGWYVRLGGKEKLVRRGHDPRPSEKDVGRAVAGWGAERITRTAAKQAVAQQQGRRQTARAAWSPGSEDVSAWDPSGTRYVAVRVFSEETGFATWELVKIVGGKPVPLDRVVSRGWKPSPRDVERAAMGWSTEEIEASAAKQQQARHAPLPQERASGFDLWRALGLSGRQQAREKTAAREQSQRRAKAQSQAKHHATSRVTVLDLSDEE